MALASLTHFGEELLNFRQYFTTATFTELSHDPLFWVAVVFAVVTSTVSVASRDDVRGYRSWAAWTDKRDEVIHRENMKQTSGATTVGTTTFEVIKRKLPIGVFEIRGEGILSGDIMMVAKSQHSQIILAVLASFLLLMLNILLAPDTHPLPALVSILEPKFSQPFLVFQTIFAILLADLLFVFTAIRLVVLAQSLAPRLTIGRIPLGKTNFAFIPKPILRTRATEEMFEIGRLPLVALGAILEGVHRSNYSKNRRLIGCQMVVT